MKYIDADKLIAEIERYKKEAAIARFDNAGENAEYFQGKVELCDDLTHTITSLQQEADYLRLLSLLLEAIDYSFMKTDKTYDTALTYPVIDKVNYIKKQLNSPCQQPEVDLEKEFEDYLDNVEGQPRIWHPDEQIEWAKDIARHFYELGKNARKEEKT